MEKIKVLTSPWKSEFMRLLKGAKKEICLASPFIKKDVASLIVESAKPNTQIKYINSFKLANYYNGVSDIEALRVLNGRNASIKSYHSLHAKVFIFDKKEAVVTSANLTMGGLFKNYEYGILIKDKGISARIARDYNALFTDKNRTWIITEYLLDKASDILKSAPKEKKIKLPSIEEYVKYGIAAQEQDIYKGGETSIDINLTDWEKDVFDVLKEIDKEIFRLSDVYEFEERLQALHPANKTVKAKIRQQLQFLRDLGLIEFLGRGVYRRLWK